MTVLSHQIQSGQSGSDRGFDLAVSQREALETSPTKSSGKSDIICKFHLTTSFDVI